jgi:hypothetical protein
MTVRAAQPARHAAAQDQLRTGAAGVNRVALDTAESVLGIGSVQRQRRRLRRPSDRARRYERGEQGTNDHENHALLELNAIRCGADRTHR